MKRTLSLLAVILLILSLSACEKEDCEDSAAPLDVNESVTESENSEVLKEPSEQQTTEKGEFYPYTTDDYFRPYEIFITFTKEETAKNKEYVAGDFENLELLYVFEPGADYKPYGDDRKTVCALVKTPSKQIVLDYIKLLEKDDRIYVATPNLFSVDDETIYFVLDEEMNDYTENQYVDKADFSCLSEFDINTLRVQIENNKLIFRAEIANSDDRKIMEYVYKAFETQGVAFAFADYEVIYDYSYIGVGISGDYYIQNPDKQYSLKDFENVPVKEFEVLYYQHQVPRCIELTLDINSQYELSKSIGSLLLNPMTESIHLKSYYQGLIYGDGSPPVQFEF